MNKYFSSLILEKTGASAFIEKEVIQTLWSGYGQIIRLELVDSDFKSVVVKHVQLSNANYHPRGWNSDIGHQRKLKSYKVESTWYESYSNQSMARLPHCLAIETHQDEVLIILEDLDSAGFSLRKHTLEWKEIANCLKWLAQFHASFMGKVPVGLWPVGTYWHLETRPQELAVLDDAELKAAASAIDKKLNSCQYKTFVHGDAKLANFCFTPNGQPAGVDFQYVGGGCGMKDVAYFVGSCMDEKASERLEGQILDTYFECLQEVLPEKNKALEAEWRSLYRVAWADFHRFLKGWSPGHWKLNSYSERITKEIINNL